MTAPLLRRQLLLGPVTGLVLLLAIVCGGRIVRSDNLALCVAAPRCGPLAWWFRATGFEGTTLGAVVLLSDAGLLRDEHLLEHEREHVRQWLSWNLLFFVAYPAAALWARVQHGTWYADNHFERAARAAAGAR